MINNNVNGRIGPTVGRLNANSAAHFYSLRDDTTVGAINATAQFAIITLNRIEVQRIHESVTFFFVFSFHDYHRLVANSDAHSIEREERRLYFPEERRALGFRSRREK